MKKVDVETSKILLDTFNNEIVPYMCNNNLSLHEAFESLKETDNNLYQSLSNLWATAFGKAYLKSFMQKHGQRLSLKTLENIKKEVPDNE